MSKCLVKCILTAEAASCGLASNAIKSAKNVDRGIGIVRGRCYIGSA